MKLQYKYSINLIASICDYFLDWVGVAGGGKSLRMEQPLEAVRFSNLRLQASCDLSTAHQTCFVKGSRNSILFADNGEIVIPWDMIFDDYSQHLLWVFEIGCISPAILYRKTNFLAGVEMYAVHCHCSKPGSLECMAQAALIRMILRKFIKCADYDCTFLQYRLVVNYNLPAIAWYHASCFFDGLHLIYLKVKKLSHCKYIVRKVNLGLFAVVTCNTNSIILVCKSCKSRQEIMVKCCMRRTRKILKKCVKVVEDKLGKQLQPSKKEKARQRMIKQFFRYNIPIPWKDF